jgi:hypothetical protein
MKPNAILQNISAYYHKERHFWYLNSYLTIIVDVVVDVDGENEMSRLMTIVSSYIPFVGQQKIQ